MSDTNKERPFAYYVYIPAEQRGELVHDLDDAVDDLTNCECEVTELFTHPETPAPLRGERDLFEAFWISNLLSFAPIGSREFTLAWQAWQWRASMHMQLIAAPVPQSAGVRDSKRRDALFDAAIELIGTLTGMKPPPIEVAPPEIFAPFHAFVAKVEEIIKEHE